MKILTWNIQATKGCDDLYDVSRIVEHIKAFGDADVICLQEVSRNIPDLNADDQLALITEHFQGYEIVWAPCFSAPATSYFRYEFGNLTLVKSPLLINSQVHSLPSPLVNTMQIPRTVAQTIVNGGSQPVAIFNTHLAFHSSIERVSQIQALTVLRDQLVWKSSLEATHDDFGPYKFSNTCDAVILCGDLNVDSDADVFKEHITNQNWVDCWDAQSDSEEKNDVVRAPTCGCFDHVQWPQGPHVKDYFLASENIADKTVRVEVNVDTNASDHQPVFLEIDL